MADKYCRKCGALNRETAKFCARCGAALEVYAPPPPPPPPVQTPPPWEAPPQYAPQSYTPEPYYTETPLSAPKKKLGFLGLATNLFAWICAGVFVLLVCLSLPILNISGRIDDGNLYKEALVQQNIYNRFPDLFAGQMALSQASLGKEAHIDFTGVGKADWKIIAEELVTADWMKKQVESMIDEIFAAMKPGAASPTLKISLSEVTQKLGQDAGFNIYKKVISTKRECTLEDFFTILDWLDQNKGVNMPICNIPPDLTEFAAWFAEYENGDALIRDILKDLPKELPTEIALSDFFVLNMQGVGKLLRQAHTIGLIGLGMAVLALLFVFVSPMGRSLKGLLLLWGIPLAIAGLICMLIAWLMPYFLGASIAGAFKGTITPELQTAINEMGRYVLKSSTNAMGWQSVIMLVVGLLMSGASVFVWGVGKVLKKS